MSPCGAGLLRSQIRKKHGIEGSLAMDILCHLWVNSWCHTSIINFLVSPSSVALHWLKNLDKQKPLTWVTIRPPPDDVYLCRSSLLHHEERPVTGSLWGGLVTINDSQFRIQLLIFRNIWMMISCKEQLKKLKRNNQKASKQLSNDWILSFVINNN